MVVVIVWLFLIWIGGMIKMMLDLIKKPISIEEADYCNNSDRIDNIWIYGGVIIIGIIMLILIVSAFLSLIALMSGDIGAGAGLGAGQGIGSRISHDKLG